MIFFSMDPLFDLAKYAMQVCLQSFPTWAPHKLFRSRKKRKGKTRNALVRKQTLEWFESTIWGVHVNYALFRKKISKLLRCENGVRWLCFRAVPFLKCSRRNVSHSTYPADTRYFWDNLYDSSISWFAMFMFTLSSTFTRDEQRFKCGGTCWRSLSHKFWPPKWAKNNNIKCHIITKILII